MGKALDNRVGCFVVAEVMNRMAAQLENMQLIGVATAQEEVGTRGSAVAAKRINADLNVVLDVANGKDTPKNGNHPTRQLGKGPALVLMDKTALANMDLLDFVQDTARDMSIPYQLDFFNGGGTDAGSVQLLGGKPTLVICIPVRYCHGWHSIVDWRDIQHTIDLICACVTRWSEKEGGKTHE